jgi:hypothetical protein
VEIHLGRLHRFVPEPESDDRAIHAVPQEFHGGRVSQHVRAHPFAFERRTSFLRRLDMTSDEPFDCIAAERVSACGGEERVSGLSVSIAQPGGHQSNGFPRQRRAALLPAFAFALQVGTGTEHDVAASEVSELGNPQPGSESEQQECAIPSADPRGDIRCREHSIDFRAREIGDRTVFVSLDRDGENPAAAIEVSGFADRHVSKEGVDRGEADIARARRVATVLLDVIQKRTDKLHDRIVGGLELCCRRGEMLLIQNKRVNWDTCQIGIPGSTAKDKENRRIPFNPKGRLAAVLKRRAGLGPDAYVFGSTNGAYQPTIQTAWETLKLRANGIEPRAGEEGVMWNQEQLRQIDLRWHASGTRARVVCWPTVSTSESFS